MLKDSFALILVILPLLLPAQAPVCEGNLGANIFEAGDFGSGTDNVVATNPGIAPGYLYDRTTPPNDGDYVLSNNTASWTNNYETWLDIPDNSPDPNGYMMVVNASFEPGLFYDQTIEGLCENTLYEFSADVINMIRRGVADHIRPNVSFLIDGEVAINTGEIPQDERWHNYGFTFTTAPGQTSVQLSLRNNAPGGIGNDLALDNISFRACGPKAFILPFEVANICEDGDPIELDATVDGDEYPAPAFQWQQSFDDGASWTDIPNAMDSIYTHDQLSSGYYYYRYLLANGPVNLQNSKCRVISNPKVVYVVPKFYDIVDTICQGLSYEQDGNAYTASGTYVDTLLSSLGCDSIVTLDLTVVPDAGIMAAVTTLDPSCHDAADGQITIETITNGAPPFTNTLSGSSPTVATVFPGLAGGDYELTITDRYGCRYRENLTLTIPPEFVVELGGDRAVTLGDPVQLRPSANLPVDTFYWQPPELIDCSLADCSAPTWYPTRTTTLGLRAVSDRGCIATDSIRVTVDKQRRIFFPNAFSPNGDGVNDVFTVFGDVPNVQLIRRLAVFDRWGALLYEREAFPPNDPAAGWDGTVAGQQLGRGIYVYVAEVEFLDGEVLDFAGDVLLLR